MPHGAHVKIDISGFKMKQVKQRVIAIDYFRGFCLFLVLVNHSVLFSMPFALWTGAGGLWTSAAEMVLLLSGITYGIVRGSEIKNQFKTILRKTWRRAAIIYSVNILVVFLSLIFALFLTSHGLTNDVNGVISNSKSFGLIMDVLTLRYYIGWADFLMYFSVFLTVAPFLLYILKTRFWPIAPVFSVTLFTAHYLNALPGDVYSNFAIWQVYFVLGLVIGRFRQELLSSVDSLSHRTARVISLSILTLAALILSLSYLVEHSIYPTISRLANDGWLPVKIQAAYIHLLNMRPSMDRFLLDGRAGLLRPAVTLLVASAAYILYRRYGSFILDKSGRFFIGLGRDSLVVFSAQALAIPLIAALPVAHGSLVNNLALTCLLVVTMRLVSLRSELSLRLKDYALGLKTSYSEAKYSYLQQYDDGN
jgi:hypothetical protein